MLTLCDYCNDREKEETSVLAEVSSFSRSLQ